MKYRIYDSGGNLTYESTTDFLNKADVPTHGSISIEVEPGEWFSFVTSEWLMCYADEEPVTHKNALEKYNAANTKRA